ncbi:hypothetical protein CLV97_12322 [Planifilum fimeticola]|uniref:PEGA domain-containing protein n=1 Tax=Planifilum fimeticola TaxID=201975 RepID=A0A2T0LC51_9BACL|nr:hypothetical protein [Planifilum fimeticola]PRX39569.1 hypothetical protein CLV97_12322 [Planifilum fimeticola]
MNVQVLKEHAMKFFKQVKGYAKNGKLVAALAVIAVLVIAVTSLTFAAADGPEEVVRKFEEAVYNKDVDALEEIVSPDDDRMKIDREHLAQFLEFIHENDKYMETTMSLLQYQLAAYQGNHMPYPDNYNYGQVDYYLKLEEGVLFDSYSIGIRPYYLHIKVDETGGTVKVDGEEVLSSKQGSSKVMGPLMPGQYKVEGTKKYPYALVKDVWELDLFFDEQGQVKVNLDLTGTHINLDSAFEDTRVIVNGKPLNKTVKELQEFGPVSLDGSITLQGERKFPWGVTRSDKKIVTEGMTKVDLTPLPFANKKGKDQIVQTINTHFKQWVAAKVKHDHSGYTLGEDSMKKELIRQINSIKRRFSKSEPYMGVVLGTRIDFDNLTFTYEDDYYVIEIPVEFHSKNNSNFRKRIEEEFETEMVTLRYDEKGKRWLIHSFAEIYNPSRYFKGKGVVKSEFK